MDLNSFLRRERLLIFYGRPSPLKKNLILHLLQQSDNLVDKIIYFDLKRCIKPHDLVGIKESLLSKIYLYWPNENTLLDALKNIFPIKTKERFLILLDPLYIQGGLTEHIARNNDPIFTFFSMKYLNSRCERSYIWLFIDTTVRKISEISFFSILRNEIPYVVYYVNLDFEVKLEIYRTINVESPVYVFSINFNTLS